MKRLLVLMIVLLGLVSMGYASDQSFEVRRSQTSCKGKNVIECGVKHLTKEEYEKELLKNGFKKKDLSAAVNHERFISNDNNRRLSSKRKS